MPTVFSEILSTTHVGFCCFVPQLLLSAVEGVGQSHFDRCAVDQHDSKPDLDDRETSPTKVGFQFYCCTYISFDHRSFLSSVD